jgi:hypothetical protein
MLRYSHHLLVLAVVCFLCVAITPLSLSLTTDSKYITPIRTSYHYHSNVFDLYLVGLVTCVGIIAYWEKLIRRFKFYIPVGLLCTFLVISGFKIAFVMSWDKHHSDNSVGWIMSVLLGVIVGATMIPLCCVCLLNVFHTLKYPHTHGAVTVFRYSGVPKKPGHTALDKLISNNDTDNKANQPGEEEEGEKSASFTRMMRWSYPEWKLNALAIFMLIISSACTMVEPLYFGRIIGEASQEHPNRVKLRTYVYILLTLFTVGALTTGLRSVAFTIVGERVVKRVRQQLYGAIMSQNIAFFDINNPRELSTRY